MLLQVVLSMRIAVEKLNQASFHVFEGLKLVKVECERQNTAVDSLVHSQNDHAHNAMSRVIV